MAVPSPHARLARLLIGLYRLWVQHLIQHLLGVDGHTCALAPVLPGRPATGSGFAFPKAGRFHVKHRQAPVVTSTKPGAPSLPVCRFRQLLSGRLGQPSYIRQPAGAFGQFRRAYQDVFRVVFQLFRRSGRWRARRRSGGRRGAAQACCGSRATAQWKGGMRPTASAAQVY
jgi:hypothetical protein